MRGSSANLRPRIAPLLAALLGAACTGPRAPSPVEGPAILLITLDTTRADRLGSYGYPLADTPTMDRLAVDGMRFTRAYAAAPLTIPSHASLLTGRLPPSHGVRDNGDFVLGEEQITLAETLGAAGYATAAITAAFPTQQRWGLDQGFELYHDHLDDIPTRLDYSDQRPADQVVDDAISVLDHLARGDRPPFVWVHLFDPHWPYDPPEPFASEHEGRPYDGEIAFADREIARLLAAWDASWPESVVLLTSDHGEGFGDGGELTHGFLLHDATLRVPLILRGPNLPAGQVIDDPVSLVDAAPTLLDLAGLEAGPQIQGLDLRSGGTHRVYAEAMTGQYNLGLAPLRSYTDAYGRYTEGSWGGWYEADGSRVQVESARRGMATRREAELLAELREELEEGVAPAAALDAAAYAQLAALGYLGGDPHAPPGDTDPRDVIDVLPLTWKARQLLAAGLPFMAERMVATLRTRMPGAHGVQQLEASIARARGQLETAEALLADLHLRAPSSTIALQLADIAQIRGDWSTAEAWYREALALQAHSPQGMAGLVRSVHRQGELALASELADEFLVVYPEHAELALLRAEVLLAEGQLEAAAREADRGLRELPGNPWAHAVAAQVAWERGEADRAIERGMSALQLSPLTRGIRLQVGSWMLEVGRAAEAVRLLAPATRIHAEDEEIGARYAEARAALQAERDAAGAPSGARSTGLLRAYSVQQAEANAAEAAGAGG